MYFLGEEWNIFFVGRMIYILYEEEFVKFLILNGKWNFLKLDKGIEMLLIKDMYKECLVFKKLFCFLGFNFGIFVEVFEIIGLIILVMYFGVVMKV